MFVMIQFMIKCDYISMLMWIEHINYPSCQLIFDKEASASADKNYSTNKQRVYF